MKYHPIGLAVFVLLLAQQLPAQAADHSKEPGRKVKVAAIALPCGGPHAEKLKLALEHLEVAGKQGVDIACLSEGFAGLEAEDAEPLPGPSTEAVAALAKKYGMYVICPIREKKPDGRHFNTAVLLDRQGNVAGCYRKYFVFWAEKGVSLGEDGVGIFDTDFGRIAILTCFDANFEELWSDADRQGVDVVFWPSAYGGGVPLNGYAAIHNYYIVANGWGNMIDLFGKTIENVEKPMDKQFIATLDLDLTILHKDFNYEKMPKLLQEHQDEVELLKDIGLMEGWFVLRSLKPGVHSRELCKQYQLETLREYRTRSRQQLNELRKAGKPIP